MLPMPWPTLPALHPNVLPVQDTACLLFTLSFLISVGASIVVLGGLAAMTAFCWDNQPLGLGAGFKMTPVRRMLCSNRAVVCLPCASWLPPVPYAAVLWYA